jgi:hypothetical protein
MDAEENQRWVFLRAHSPTTTLYLRNLPRKGTPVAHRFAPAFRLSPQRENARDKRQASLIRLPPLWSDFQDGRYCTPYEHGWP